MYVHELCQTLAKFSQFAERNSLVLKLEMSRLLPGQVENDLKGHSDVNNCQLISRKHLKLSVDKVGGSET
jgi:hypothetical protein